MDFRATETSHMASKMFYILISFVGTLQSVSCNKKCTTHLCDTHSVQYTMSWSSGFMYLLETGSR